MYKSENAFCIKCTTPLRNGIPVCECTSADTERTVLVKAVFCERCNRELYVDEKCNCVPANGYVYCAKCGTKLNMNERCACSTKPVSSSYFGKAGDL
jgi:hypothetical protein